MLIANQSMNTKDYIQQSHVLVRFFYVLAYGAYLLARTLEYIS